MMRAMRPLVVGSGKPGTPCERMQSENIIPVVVRVETCLPGVLGRELDEPHAVIASRQAQAATIIGMEPVISCNGG